MFRASRTIESGVIDGMRLPASRGIAGWVARNRQAVRLDDVASDPRHFAGVGEQTGLAPRTMICVPMVSKDTLRGVIQILNKVDDSTFTEAELSLAQTLADHAAIAIENASLYRQAYVASITDDLTGLGNTRHFHRSLADAMARGRPVSLVILDLDNFKAVVDRYGHLAGSRSIAQIGRVIGRLARPGDVAARFGGDEFVIVLPDTDTEEAHRLAESIRKAIEACEQLETRTSTSHGSRRASASRRSRFMPPTRRACSARPTRPCTRPSARARTGCRWPRTRRPPSARSRPPGHPATGFDSA